MGFQRTKLNYKHMRRKEVKQVVPPPLDEQLIHALCAMKLSSLYSHDLQGPVTEWIRENYGPVNPETVQRTWRKLVESEEIIVEKEKKGRLVHYRVLKLGSIWLDERQGKLF